jgi:CHAT domain-containing protein/Tfp pilus assembly protein PilF
MSARWLLLGLLLSAPPGVFGAAPPLGPDRPLTGEERRVLAKEQQRTFAAFQKETQAGRLKEAIELARQDLVLREQLEGSRTEAFARALEWLARHSQEIGADEEAIRYWGRVYRVKQQLHPPGDWRIVDARWELEDARHHAQRDRAARQQLQRAENLNEQALGLRERGRSKEALPLAVEALALRRKILGEKHPDVAESANVLGLLSQELGEHSRARSLFEQALALIKEVQGEKHPVYAASLNNLAMLDRDMGKYASARPLLEQAVALNKELLGQKHPDYGHTLNNLALVYMEMGEYGRARPLYEQALALYKEVLGAKHPLYALGLNNLAFLHKQMGEYARARPLYEQALALHKEVLGEKHPSSLSSLNNLASLHHAMGEYARARPLFEQALALIKEVQGEKHPHYALSLNNLANLYQDMGEYARARSLYEQALTLHKEVEGEKHPAYALTLHNLASLAWQEGKPEAASKQLAQALQILHQHLDATFSALSERQRLAFLAQSRQYLDRFLSVSALAGVAAAEVHQGVLAWKGMVTARQAEEVLARDHPELVPLLKQLWARRAALAQLANRLPDPDRRARWRERLAELEKDKDDLEFQLAQKSSFRALRALDSKVVSNALPEGTALVDLLEYWHDTPDPAHKGQWRLVAFVLVKGKDVVRIELGAARPIAEAVRAWREPVQAGRPVDEKAAGQLRHLVWDKLAPSLKGSATVVVAPDGVLCSLPWSALPGSKLGTYLIEEVAIAQIPSARQLLGPPSHSVSAGLLVLGGLDYGKRPAEGSFWPALPGTRLEAERVSRLYQDRFPAGGQPVDLSGATVSKDRLLAALTPDKGEPRRRWLHLATHGYFQAPRPSLALARGGASRPLREESVSYIENPLLLSGLVLSGANGDPEGGILTALEVSNLDLRGCELVVLSACETGLGKIEAGEGLLGLQRAFHVAGARTVVSSLWSVSDPATSVLMEQFYQNLWGERPLSRLEALRQAQLYVLKHPEAVRERARQLRTLIARAGRGSAEELRGKGKEVELSEPRPPGSGGLSHPAWWAPFVLSGDIGPVKP